MVDLTLKWQLLISLLVIVLSSCEEESGPLPAKTHEGRNTIGYYVTLENYFGNPDGYIGATWNETGDTCYKDSNGIIHLSDKDANRFKYYSSYADFYLNIDFEKDSVTSLLKLSKVNYIHPEFNHSFYYQDADSNYYCEITYHNETKRIISGIFEFDLTRVDTMQNLDTTFFDTTNYGVKITSGRFDMRY